MSANFTSNTCNNAVGSASGGPFTPDDGKMIINGSSDLSACICGAASDAYIEQIWVEDYEGVQYHYKIHVLGRGPSGMGNTLDLKFFIGNVETVTLSLSSTTVEDHDVKCINKGVTMFTWDVN